MKLNHDCVRDLLLLAEERLADAPVFSTHNAQLGDYDLQTITHTAEKLLEAGFIVGKKNTYIRGSQPIITISSLSWEGHQFLDNIRDDGIWKETKNALSKLSSVSLSIASNVASQVVSQLVKNSLDI